MRLALTLIVALAILAPGGQSSVNPSANAPLQLWSDPATWDGDPPEAGDVVTIPDGKRVLLDVSPPVLAGLTIDGELTFDRRDLALTTEWIVVSGLLQIGTPDRSFTDQATITLTDTEPDEDIQGMGDRVLGQIGGRVDLHGAPTAARWTRLAANAEAADDTLTLERPVDWRPGDRIVLASTDFDADQAEEATIAEVDGATVRLEEPLAYLHWGADQRYGDGVVSERAEVALLSSNLVIQADASAEETHKGGHVMSMAGQLRMSNVELTRMGQAGELARYPIHFHLKGDAPGDEIRDVAIHESYNRCITLHGTNRVALTGNVAFDALGHCYCMEDGAETGNVLTGNLGILTRAPEEEDRLLPSDVDPATFWVTNPANDLVGNVAAGSDGMGFWLAFPEHPTGLSQSPESDATVWPRRTPLGAFRDNVAHSNGRTGLHVDDGPAADGTTSPTFHQAFADPIPPADGGEDYAVAVDTRFERMTAYKNRERGIWLRGGNQVVSGAVLADNGIGTTFASYDATIDGALVVGESANAGSATYDDEPRSADGRSLPYPYDPSYRISGVEFYDGPIAVTGVTFAGFLPTEERRASGIAFLRDNAFQLDPTSYAETITWLDDSTRVYNAPARPAFDGDKMRLFVDRDGSVTGAAGAVVTADTPFLRADGCMERAEWNSLVCDARYVAIQIDDLTRGPVPVGPVYLTRPDGVSVALVGVGGLEPDEDTPATTWATNLLPGQPYRLTTMSETFDLRVTLATAEPGDTLLLVLPWDGANAPIVSEGELSDDPDYRLQPLPDTAALDAASDSAYTWDPAAGTLTVKLVIRPGEADRALDIERRD